MLQISLLLSLGLAAATATDVQPTCGGCSGQTYADASGKWEVVDSGLFTPRHHPIAFSANGFGYVMAGIDGSRQIN